MVAIFFFFKVPASFLQTVYQSNAAQCIEAAKKYGDNVVELVKEDLKTCEEKLEKQNYSKEEIFDSVFTQMTQNMIVVR